MKTAIIILHYENEQLTNQCVKSIRDNTEWGTYHIIIVDNNSPVPYRRTTPIMGNETVIRNDNNLSVSGMNFGFYHALYKLHFKPAYIVNFDNDIICLDNWLPPLISTMEEDASVGIVGGKQWDKHQAFYACVGWDLFGILYKDYPEIKKNVLWIQGSFHMYRAEMMRKIGLHDERYKIIASDSDYCFNANDRGWKVVFVPDSNVIHLGSASYGKKPTEYDKLDKGSLIKKWYGIKFAAMCEKVPISLNQNVYARHDFEMIQESRELCESILQ